MKRRREDTGVTLVAVFPLWYFLDVVKTCVLSKTCTRYTRNRYRRGMLSWNRRNGWDAGVKSEVKSSSCEMRAWYAVCRSLCSTLHYVYCTCTCRFVRTFSFERNTIEDFLKYLNFASSFTSYFATPSTSQHTTQHRTTHSHSDIACTVLLVLLRIHF